ncbi:MAG: neutral/alkaline non-lysosomal ceramidase N-terminal domain-containing protein [Myxococcota bacterium]
MPTPTATLVYQGFHHTWAKIPHRVSRLVSGLEIDEPALDEPALDAPDALVGGTVAGMNSGADGDVAHLVTFYSALAIPGLRVLHGELRIEVPDGWDGAIAKVLLDPVPHDSGLAVGLGEIGVVLLRGFDWDPRRKGAARAIWPTRIDLGVRERVVDGRLHVVPRFHVEHQDAPDIKGAPRTPTLHHVTLRYTALVAPAAHLSVVDVADQLRVRDRLLEDGEGFANVQLTGPRGLAHALCATSGLSFRMGSHGPAPHGRYFQALAWGVEDGAWDVVTGTMNVGLRVGVRANKLVWPARYDAGLDGRLLVFDGARLGGTASTAARVRVEGSVETPPLARRPITLTLPAGAEPDLVEQMDRAGPELEGTRGLDDPSEGGLLVRDPAPRRAPRGARCGAALRDFDIPSGRSLAGYSSDGGKGGKGVRPLQVRALVLEDDEGHVVAFAAVELHSATRYLHERVAALTRRASCGLDVHQVVLLGTHTHNGPGNFYGNTLYDLLCQSKPGFDKAFADDLADAIADAIDAAWRSAVPATPRVDVETVWGASRNRSLVPFQANSVAARWNTESGLPGALDPASSSGSPQQRAVDPRVVVLSAWDRAGRCIGAMATFGCHNTALGIGRKGERTYSPDWAGLVSSAVEAALPGNPPILMGLSGSGDVSPLPPSDEGARYLGPKSQGLLLARFVADKVGAAVRRALLKAPTTFTPVRLRSWYEDWASVGGADVEGVPNTTLGAWDIGAPSLGGADDYYSGLHPWAAREGMVGDHYAAADPQFPKAPALGVLGNLVRGLQIAQPAPVHGLHVVLIGDHAFATVPGEPTTVAAWTIEQAVREATGAASASVIGYTADYAGYYTTRAEYRFQHYEGAATLYGRHSVPHLAARLARLVETPPFVAPARTIPAFPSADTLERGGIPTPDPIASGTRRDGATLYAWWAWHPEFAPSEPPIVLLYTADAPPRPPDDLARHAVAVAGEDAVVWTAEFLDEEGVDGAWRRITCVVPPPFTAVELEVGEATRGDLFLTPEGAAGDPELDALYTALRGLPEERSLEAFETDAGAQPLARSDLGELHRRLAVDPAGLGRQLHATVDAVTVLDDDAAAAFAVQMVGEIDAAFAAPVLAIAAVEAERAPADEDTRGLFDKRHVPALPANFDFDGYDPLAIPIDPAETRFQTKEDTLAYLVLTGAGFHTGVLKLDPERHAHDFDSRFTYPLRSPKPGEPVDIGLFGDFANGLAHSRYVARQLVGLPYAIHLGDVYYSGRQEEFDAYLAGPLAPLLPDTELFLLAGNHEMYSRGLTFHRYLDQKRARFPDVQKQEGASFRLLGDKFQIIGLDTEWWKHGRVRPEMVERLAGWLREGRPDRMNILLTSEHGYDYGSPGVSTLLSRDLKDVLAAGLVDLWFWGNVHHAALYRPGEYGPFAASCVGHAGYPYYTLDPDDQDRCAAPLEWAEFKSRFYGFDDTDGAPLRPDVGNNGWCKLRLHDDGHAELVYTDWRKVERHVAHVTRTPGGVKVT